MGASDEYPVLSFDSAKAFERWLRSNHRRVPGVWLAIAKKGAGIDSVSYPEALDVALCYGWIDGQKQKHDERAWLQRFTPRRRGSKWSEVNRDKANALITAGRMRPAGLAEIEAARADGRWDAAYAPQSRAQVPADLQAILDTKPQAKAFFVALDSRNRYAILHRVQDAKKPETRARRIDKYVAMLARGETIY